MVAISKSSRQGIESEVLWELVSGHLCSQQKKKYYEGQTRDRRACHNLYASRVPSSRHFAVLTCKWHPVQTLDPVHSFAVPEVARLEGNEAAVEAAQVPHGQTRFLNRMTKARGSQNDSSR